MNNNIHLEVTDFRYVATKDTTSFKLEEYLDGDKVELFMDGVSLKGSYYLVDNEVFLNFTLKDREYIEYSITRTVIIGDITGTDGIQGEVGPMGPQGERGYQGEQGIQGVQGPQGIEGPKGTQGIRGPKGDSGLNINIIGELNNIEDLPSNSPLVGDSYIINPNKEICIWNGSNWINAGKIQGIEGPQGIEGVQGLQGPQGVQGLQGPRGEQGIDGINGTTPNIQIGEVVSLPPNSEPEVIRRGTNENPIFDFYIPMATGNGSGGNIDPEIELRVEEIEEKLQNKIDKVETEDTIDGTIIKFYADNIEVYRALIQGGGGGSGGNNTAPLISSDFDKDAISIEEKLRIPFYVTDTEGGSMTARFTINNNYTDQVIPLGSNEWNIGLLEKGTHLLKISVKDRAGLVSNELRWLITVGGLEITSNFRTHDREVGEEVLFEYTVMSVLETPTDVTIDVNGRKTTINNVVAGKNVYNLGLLPRGVYNISVVATSGNIISNTLKYSFSVTDSDSIFIMSTFEDCTIDSDTNLIVTYRISYKESDTCYAYYTLNGRTTKAEVKTGYVNWRIGYLEAGQYNLRIRVTNIAGNKISNDLDYTVIVKSTGLDREPYIENLLCWFDADKMSNEMIDKETWEDLSGNKTKVNFHNVNFINNGWIDGSLVLNGDAYAEILLNPLYNGVGQYGLTIDVLYKAINVGSPNARVLSYEEARSSGGVSTGLAIDVENAYITGAISKNKIATMDEEYIRVTLVIDPVTHNATFIYLNGVCCNSIILKVEDSFRVDNGYIYLNAQKLANGTMGNQGSIEVKNIRVYDEALNYTHILDNHIYDIKDIEKKKEIILRNDPDKVPSLIIKCSDEQFKGTNKDDYVVMGGEYVPNTGPGDKIVCDNIGMRWQGASTLQYDIKNWTVRFYDKDPETGKLSKKNIKFFSDWPEESTYVFKVNMIDSSQAFNTGIAKLTNYLIQEPIPPMITEPDNKLLRHAIDGFACVLFFQKHSYEDGSPDDIEPQFYSLGNVNCTSSKFFAIGGKPGHFKYSCELNSGNGAASFHKWSDQEIEEEYSEFATGRKPGNFENYPEGKHNEFRRFIKWVHDATDEEFKRDIEEYMSLSSAMDYYLIVYALGLVDSLGKNMGFHSWDGQRWYLAWWDMDTAFGFSNWGELIHPPHVACPEEYETHNSILWEKIARVFKEELDERYKVMRIGNLKAERVVDVLYRNIISHFGEGLYNFDAINKYLKMGDNITYLNMSKGDRYIHLRRWMRDRLIYMDSLFNYSEGGSNTIIVRTRYKGNWRISFKTSVQLSMRAEHGHGIHDSIMVTPNAWSTFEVEATGAGINFAYSWASHMTHIDGLANKDLTMLDVSKCERLVDLDCSGNPALTNIDLSNCIRLNHFNARNCTGLGSTSGQGLDFSKCVNLRTIDISNTSVPGMDITGCSYLTKIDISNTPMQIIEYANLLSLSDLNVSNCPSLRTLKISNCINIEELNVLNNGDLTTLELVDCNKLRKLVIDGSVRLSNINIKRCNALEEIVISNVGNLSLVDISQLNQLKKLIIKENPSIKTIIFGTNENLKELDISGTGIENLDFTNTRADDITGESKNKSIITSLKMDKTKHLRVITEINFHCLDYSSANMTFAMHDRLEIITGKITFDPTIDSLSGMFRNCTRLKSLPAMDTKNIVNFADFFNGCLSLETINIDTLNTINAIDMSRMFYDCLSLRTIPLIDTGRVKYMNSIFYNCQKLRTCPNLNTGNVLDFGNMFMNCMSLSACPTFNTINTTNFSGMFSNCSQITKMPEYNLANAKTINSMFSNCSGLEGDIMPDYITSKCEDFGAFISGTRLTRCKTLDMSKATTVSALFYSCSYLTTIDMSVLNLPLCYDFSFLFGGCNSLKAFPTLIMPEARNTSYMFSGCSMYSTLPDVNMTKVTEAANMFDSCLNLTSLPNGFNVDKVTILDYLFSGCNKLTSIPNMDTSNCRSMLGTFRYCYELTSIPILNTSKVTNMIGIFEGCFKLESIPVPFNTDNIIEMDGAFKDCRKLTTIPPLNTKRLTSVKSLFDGCESLITFPDLNTENCINMNRLFAGCNALTSDNIPKLSSLAKVIDMSEMFSDCINIIDVNTLRLSETTKCLSMRGIFNNCTKLTSAPHFNTINVTEMDDMFRNCKSLVGIPEYDVTNVVTMRSMLQGCDSFTSFPEGLNTISLKDTSFMFYECISPDLISIPYFDTSKVINMGYMFAGCTYLKEISLKFRTYSANGLPGLFTGCRFLTSDKIPARLETESCNNFDGTFQACAKLTTLPIINTENAVSMISFITNMLGNNSLQMELTELPELKTSKVINMTDAIVGCSQLGGSIDLDLESCTQIGSLLSGVNKPHTLIIRNLKLNFYINSWENLTSLEFPSVSGGVTITATNCKALDYLALNKLYNSLSQLGEGDGGVLDIRGGDKASITASSVSIANNKGWEVLYE